MYNSMRMSPCHVFSSMRMSPCHVFSSMRMSPCHVFSSMRMSLQCIMVQRSIQLLPCIIYHPIVV